MIKNINQKQYFTIILATLLLTNFAILLNIPVLRQVLGFIYFTIAPGLLIINILKPNKMELPSKFVLSIGLSIAFLMFAGLLVNSFYPFINRPLSLIPLIISLDILLIIFAFVALKRYKNDFDIKDVFNLKFDLNDKLISPLLLSILFPFMAVFGTYLMKARGDNFFLLFMLFLIPVYIVAITFLRDKIPKSTYPVALYTISLALLLTQSLRCKNIPIGDISIEYYVFKITLERAYWAFGNFLHNYNSCLSVTILPSIFYQLLNIDSKILFKTIYPLIGSFIPVTAYIIFQKFTNKYYAFLASFFIIGQFPFITLIGSTCRQIIALFIFYLLVLIFIEGFSEKSKREDSIQRKFLTIFLALSLIVSHYSSSIFYLLILMIFFVVKEFIPKKPKSNIINISFIVLLFTSMFFWYSQVTGTPFIMILKYMKANIYNLIELGLEEIKSEKVLLLSTNNIAEMVTILIHNITFGFSFIGSIILFRQSRKIKKISYTKLFSPYILACTIFMIILTIVFYYSGYGPWRTYLQYLAFFGFCIPIGIKSLFKKVNLKRLAVYGIVILAILQFLAGTYLVFQIFGIHYWEAINSDGPRYQRYYVYDGEVVASFWLNNHKDRDKLVWGGNLGRFIYSQINARQARGWLSQQKDAISGYVFLRYTNILGKMYSSYDNVVDISNITHQICSKSKIYDNGYSNIFYGK